MDQAGPQTREKIARDVQRLWQESAYFWDKHRATIAEMFAPLTDALIESAHIAAGHSVLDVGGGVGEPSLPLALARHCKVVEGREHRSGGRGVGMLVEPRAQLLTETDLDR